MTKQPVTLTVNDQEYQLLVSPTKTLLDVLRDKLGLTGTKRGCDSGECGSCTVLADGIPILSCMTLAVERRARTYGPLKGWPREVNFIGCRRHLWKRGRFSAVFALQA